MRYAKQETTIFIFGIFFLLLGCVGDFIVPYYVGKVITALSAGDYDAIGTYCLHMFLIICVSNLKYLFYFRAQEHVVE
jgi:ABC-type multidrug transport system fused ATPase/permease subunit